MNRRIALLGIIGFATFMGACGGGSHPLTLAITTAPPSSMEINGTTQVTASVTNDSSNKGVDWSCTPAAACGTFTPTHTASGANTIYQAPGSTGSVTLTAASTTTPMVTKAVSVTIDPIGNTSNLKGAYTFFANGWNKTQGPYSVAGSVALDGNGNATGGEQDYFSLDYTNNTSTVDTADAIKTGGTVNLGSDGRGTLTITPTKAPPETFSITFVNNDHLMITEFDSNATSSGSMDLQTSPASVPTGGNAMTLHDPNSGLVVGGVITVSGMSITGGEGDVDSAGTVTSRPFSGSLTAPDAAGRGTISLFNTTQFTYYVVGPEAFRMIETDGDLATGNGTFLAGSIYGQGATSNAFSAASLKGNFAFSQAGETVNPFPAYGVAGQFTTDGSATLTGIVDINTGDGSPLKAVPLAMPPATSAHYIVNTLGHGSITLPTAVDGLANFGIYLVDPNLNIVDPNSTMGGGGALLLDLDTNSVGSGIIVPQASGTSFAGNYAFNEDGSYQTSSTSGFFDILGQFLSDGSSMFAGKADYNDANHTGLNPNVTVNGMFAPDAANPGRSTAQLTLTGQTMPNNIKTNSLSVYQASTNLLLHVDMDSPAAGSGIIAVGTVEKQQ